MPVITSSWRSMARMGLKNSGSIILPGMNGTEVILKVRAESLETSIIALSAGGELGPKVALTVPKALNIQTLSKPVEPAALLEAVKVHFR